jgi:hypothetical protein
VDEVNKVKKLWSQSAPLTFTALLMSAAFVASAAGIFLDPRIIGGAPAWMKPAKFAISVAIYSATIAWLYQYIEIWPRWKQVFAWTLSIVGIAEVLLIDVQAARGTISHFNVATPKDQLIFGVMGLMILFLWLASAGVAVALFKQSFADQTWGWALRLGMLLSVIGSTSGGLMIPPTPAQTESIRAGHPQAVGAHTVGAPDGGPGLPGVGWSSEHGDLRIPHFLGLHAIQIIPFFGWLAARRRASVGAVFVIAASYLSLMLILVWQAMRGESIVAPDSSTLAALATWVVASAIALKLATTAPPLKVPA